MSFPEYVVPSFTEFFFLCVFAAGTLPRPRHSVPKARPVAMINAIHLELGGADAADAPPTQPVLHGRWPRPLFFIDECSYFFFRAILFASYVDR